MWDFIHTAKISTEVPEPVAVSVLSLAPIAVCVPVPLPVAERMLVRVDAAVAVP
jgi:hypothetical protein